MYNSTFLIFHQEKVKCRYQNVSKVTQSKSGIFFSPIPRYTVTATDLILYDDDVTTVEKDQNRKFLKQLPDTNRLFWVASLTNKLTLQK